MDPAVRPAEPPPRYNGCKLWGTCRGQICRADHPHNGEFRTHARLPAARPEGVVHEDRVLHCCPQDTLDGRTWSTVVRWADWEYTGRLVLPFPGHLEDQPSWDLEAFQVLSGEQALIDGYELERELARRKKGRG